MFEHYFTESPKSKRQKEFFRDFLLGNEINIHSASSVFSVKEVDFGTRLLTDNVKIPEGKVRVLDLGSGYGVVGIAVKMKYPESLVTMIDINERSVKLSEQNCKENKVECEVLKSDLFAQLKNREFDVILTNPPFSAGKDLCIKFIKESYDHLAKNGTLQLVAPHNKGGESLKKIMIETFGNVDDSIKKSGYRVYVSIKKV
jgi:16S rRNA G1207 methylase RsmC